MTRKWKKAMCSTLGYSRKKNTCYADTSLIKMKKFWNLSYPKNKIYANTTAGIWKQLYHKMNNVCDKENCWLEQPFMRNKIDEEMRDAFAPKHPSSWKQNPTEWLSNVDIANVLKQYEKRYKCFRFLGPFPRDFDAKSGSKCIEDEMCRFQLQKHIADQKHKMGFVFNTDPHYKSGEHWISLFIHVKNKEIFFFDSAGDKAIPEIKTFVERIIQQGKDLNIHFYFDENTYAHQKTSTECGMYSLYFIINMLRDKITRKTIKTTRIPDEEMIKHRKIYFNE